MQQHAGRLSNQSPAPSCTPWPGHGRLQSLHHPTVPSSRYVALGGDEAVMAYMQQHARRTLRALRPDNYAPFAELFVAALLQAAATGESLLDSKLEDLAKRDVAKFYRLNQRMQARSNCYSLFVVGNAVHVPTLLANTLWHMSEILHGCDAKTGTYCSDSPCMSRSNLAQCVEYDECCLPVADCTRTRSTCV